MNDSVRDPKLAKKLAKAESKAAKKRVGTEAPADAPAAASPVGGRSPAERSADAAERQVALQRWRVILAVVAALVALATLLIMWQRG
jgi:hypothetical protein